MAAEPMRNEMNITLNGAEYTMRATFGAIRGIERDLRTNLVPLIEKLACSDIGVEQMSVIIFHGLRGYDDTSMGLEEVGEAVVKGGIASVAVAVSRFLSLAMSGVSLGKSAEEA